MQSSITVETKIYEQGLIEQITSGSALGIQETYMRTVIRTQEQQIRDALIALGWTPPPVECSAAGSPKG